MGVFEHRDVMTHDRTHVRPDGMHLRRRKRKQRARFQSLDCNGRRFRNRMGVSDKPGESAANFPNDHGYPFKNGRGRAANALHYRAQRTIERNALSFGGAHSRRRLTMMPVW